MDSLPGGGELKTVSRGANCFEDFEGAIAFLGELLHGSKGSNICAFEPYFRTNFKRGEVVPFGVIIRLHDSGGFSKSRDGIVASGIQLGYAVGGGWIVREV